MSEENIYERIKQLFGELCSGRIKEAARKKDDTGSWTRERNMPLHDILRCILGKKGLSTVMEVRHYFGAAEKEGQTVSKQDYLQQRQKLNPEVFKLLNVSYLKGFYSGAEVQEWNGYLVMAADGSRRTKVRRRYRTARKTGKPTGRARTNTGKG